VISTVRPERRNFFLAHRPSPDLIASTGFAVLSPKECAWPWLYIAATQPEVFEELGRLADGGAYPAVRPDVIGSLSLALPPPDLTLAFARITEPLLDRIELNLAQNRSLAQTRDTLLPKLLSGEIRISEEVTA
jgi:type I restriction enzyme, S subunit